MRGAHLLVLASPARTDSHNRDLAMVLALVAGVLNSVGFLAVGFYTSHMTGITAGVADHVVLGGARIVGFGLLSIASFLLGVMVCAWLFNWARLRKRSDRYALVLTVEAVLISFIAVVADLLVWNHRDLLLVSGLCLTMGLQNALITKVAQSPVRTTHVTGMLTDLGIELGKITYRNRRPEFEPVRGDLRKLGMLCAMVGLFALGGVVGASGYLWVGYAFMFAPAALLFAIAVPTVLRRRQPEPIGPISTGGPPG